MRRHYQFAHWILSLVFSILFKMRFYNRELVPQEDGAILVSNHLSNLDPLILGVATPRETSYLAKMELFRNPLLGWLIRSYNAVPVRRGRIDRELIYRLKKKVQEGGILLVFPEGTRSKTGNMGKARPGTGMLARQAMVPVVPACIRLSDRPWKAIFRRDEVSVTFGVPLTVEELTAYPENNEGYRHLADELLERIQRIKENR